MRWPRSVRRARSARAAGLSVSGLSFHATPGPLLAIVGLCGGAGVSVLAHLIAVSAAGSSKAQVLLADTGGPTAGLALYSGATAPLTLADVSDRLGSGERVAPRFWADAPDGLRVLAGVPQFTVQGTDESVRRVLRDARAVHGLTVVERGNAGKARRAGGPLSCVACRLGCARERVGGRPRPPSAGPDHEPVASGDPSRARGPRGEASGRCAC